MSERRQRPHTPRIAPLAVILALFIFIFGIVSLCTMLPEKAPETLKEPDTQQQDQPQNDPQGTPPAPTGDAITATIGVQGDILMHLPVVETAVITGENYDFTSIFRYITDYVQSYDYAVANLETTLAGSSRPYSGYPAFNCPDGIVSSVVDAGYDMLLTANNHSYDTQLAGFDRTLEQVRGAGLQSLGTYLNDQEQKFSVIDVGGIKLGMICYTYATGLTDAGYPKLNGIPMSQGGKVNFFTNDNLDRFYKELTGMLADAKSAGAEATVLYIHWGEEYQLRENATQQAIAQKVCDLGVDVIVGGHPHVVQPVDLLESTTDPSHKTVCIYSVGNAVSNQRRDLISSCRTGHTEDGALFTVTFEKAPDGTVSVADADVIPTWVNMSTVNGQKEYNILPLDDATRDQWKTSFNLTDALYQEAVASYDRTMAIVGDGLTEVQTWLTGNAA